MKVLAVFAALVAVAVGYPTVPTTWSLGQLSDAITNPNTDPAILPLLEQGLNEIMTNLMAGVQQESVNINLPIITPSPAIVAPEVVEAPVAPVPATPAVVAPAAADSALIASPIVQIILNLNQQQNAVPSPAVIPGIAGAESVVEHIIDPVSFIDYAVEQPLFVDNVEPALNPIDVIAIAAPETNPIDVIAVAAPETNPIDVIAIAAPETNPIDVIAIAAPETSPIDAIAVAAPEVNPIDVIAIAAPEVNPIGLISPNPAVNPKDAGNGILV